MVGLVLVCLVVGLVCGDPLPTDIKLRSEIEEAARDSRQLADDLAGMLARLEGEEEEGKEAEEEEEQEVVAAVLEEDKDVEAALQEMIKRIEKLAETTEEQGLKSSIGSLAEEREEEEELHETLIELENVAKEIEFVAATSDKKSDTDAIETMAKVLKEVSERLKGVEESAKSKKTDSKKTSGKNNIDLDVLDDEENDDLKKEDNIETLLEDLLSKSSSEDKEESSPEEMEKQKPRSGKQLDDDLLDVLDEKEEEEEEEEKKEDQEDREGRQEDVKQKEKLEEGPKETCEDKPQSDRVQVCTPDFESKESPVQFYTKKPVQSQYCFNVTKTVCEERSQAVSKEVCTYEYQQKEVIAPAHLAEVGFERQLETFTITKCEKKLVKDGYKEKEVEACYKEYVDVPYRVPTVSERIEDFVELSAPVPEKRCRLVKYDVPEVVCQDMVNKECVTVTSLEKDVVNTRITSVHQQYRGDCQGRDLEQTTTVCTVEEKVKRTSYPQYNAYRG